MDAEFLSLKRAAARFGVGHKTLRARIRQARLPAYRNGNRLLVKPDDVRRMIERDRVHVPTVAQRASLAARLDALVAAACRPDRKEVSLDAGWTDAVSQNDTAPRISP